MAKESVLKAESRAANGTSAARRLRREGWLPAVINDEKGAARAVRLVQHDFEQMLHRHRSESLILDVCVDSEPPRKMLLKEVQHHPINGRPLHADLVEISMTRKMRVNITVRLVGEPVGVTQEGGILEQPLRALEVECLPADLVEEVTVDVSQLKLNHSILVRDLKLSPTLTLLSPGDIAVAAVSAPRAEEEEVKPEEGAAATEPELIGAKEKEEAAAEAAAEGGEKGGEKKAKPEKGAEKAEEKADKGKAEKPKEKQRK
jgi:large subunit ribosomal protein L25